MTAAQAKGKRAFCPQAIRSDSMGCSPVSAHQQLAVAAEADAGDGRELLRLLRDLQQHWAVFRKPVATSIVNCPSQVRVRLGQS